MSDIDLDQIRDELSEFAEAPRKGGGSQLEERVLAGFEEIQRFVESRGHAPRHGESLDIFERLYAVRLDRIRASNEMSAIVRPHDRQGLLTATVDAAPSEEELDEDALLAELEGIEGAAEITRLKHVRSSAEKRAAEEIANREPCRDFDEFRGLFQKVQKELSDGIRQTARFEENAEIAVGQWFIVEGQIAYVAEKGEVFLNAQGREDARLRVIYDNATESNLLMRSLQKALWRDQTGRRILEPGFGPLFGSEAEEGDIATGTVYVLRSKSDHPDVVANRDLLHKIGVTGGDMKRRLANAKHDPTFLLADVEVVATYKLANINRVKLENLIHRIFEPARLEIQIVDRFGKAVVPREWFLVPLYVVDEAIKRIQDGTITEYVYDAATASLVKA
ncbi:MAG: GIY-YIG nuclease family protein [Trueperaceae bacterium]|nr:GIY-YIG nuclease family protein [Trueperaceae bacterium]